MNSSTFKRKIVDDTIIVLFIIRHDHVCGSQQKSTREYFDHKIMYNF